MINGAGTTVYYSLGSSQEDSWGLNFIRDCVTLTSIALHGQDRGGVVQVRDSTPARTHPTVKSPPVSGIGLSTRL